MKRRLELVEREIAISQSAQDRHDGVWHVWTNDPFWFRRLAAIGAEVVKDSGGSKEYKVQQRMILLRKVPKPREGRPGLAEYFERKVEGPEQKLM